MKIALIVSSLRMGGAERVLSMLANNWVRSGHSITVITIENSTSDFFRLESGIQRATLDSAARRLGNPVSVVRASIQRIRLLRRLLTALQPDAVLSFGDVVNIFTLVAAIRTRIPVVISEVTDPRHHRIRRHWAILRWLVYRRAATLVIKTHALRRWAAIMAHHRPVAVIPNPVSLDRPQYGRLGASRMEHSIIAIGRLVDAKGFDILIRAFARLHARLPQWRLTIFGDGPARGTLVDLIRHQGLEDVARLPGSTRTPDRELAHATLFILSSRYEGFPNVLLEAMAAGLPVIATDCPSGPAEIVASEINGLLVPPNDEIALADAMLRLAADATLRQRLGHNALRQAQRFQIDRIAGIWEAAIRRAMRL